MRHAADRTSRPPAVVATLTLACAAAVATIAAAAGSDRSPIGAAGAAPDARDPILEPCPITSWRYPPGVASVNISVVSLTEPGGSILDDNIAYHVESGVDLPPSFVVDLSGDAPLVDFPPRTGVRVRTRDADAVAGEDYTPFDRAYTFPQGYNVLGQHWQAGFEDPYIRVLDDTEDEPDESLYIEIVEVVNGVVDTCGAAEIIILDDDGAPTTDHTFSFRPEPTSYLFSPGPAPTGHTFSFPPGSGQLAIGDAASAEDSTWIDLPLWLSEPWPVDIPVDFVVQPGSATPDLDYLTHFGQAVIPAGSTLWTVQVGVIPDAIDEPDQDVLVSVSAPGVTIARDIATGTIIDDDPPPDLFLDQPAAAESNRAIRFVLALGQSSEQLVSVGVRTADGTAIAGVDYVQLGVDPVVPCAQGASAAYPCRVEILPGELATAVDVELIADEVAEDDETVLLQLFDPVNAILAVTQGEGIIFEDD